MDEHTPHEPSRGFIALPENGVPSTPPAGLFQPLTAEEQEQFGRLQAATSGLVETSRLALMRTVLDGRDRACVVEVVDAGDEYLVTPLAVLIDNADFERMQPDENPTAHGITTVQRDDDVEPQVLYDLLTLVQDSFPGEQPSIETIRTMWSAKGRREVADWAAAVHLVASDNDDVEIPPLPVVLRGNS